MNMEQEVCAWCGRRFLRQIGKSAGGHWVCAEKCRLDMIASIATGQTKEMQSNAGMLVSFIFRSVLVLGSLLVVLLIVLRIGAAFEKPSRYAGPVPDSAEPLTTAAATVNEAVVEEYSTPLDPAPEPVYATEQSRQQDTYREAEILTTDPIVPTPEESVDELPSASSTSTFSSVEEHAQYLLAQDASIRDVARVTGLEKDEVRRIRRKMKRAEK